MKTKNLVMALVTAGVLGATGYGLYALGMHRGMSMATAPASTAAHAPENASGPSPAQAAATVVAPANESGEDATRRPSALR